MKGKHKNCVVGGVAAAATTTTTAATTATATASATVTAAASGVPAVVAGTATGSGLNIGIGGISVATATEKMKSVILYPYGPLTGTGCCRMLHAKNLAITSAIYTINISLLIVLIYCWRINVNIKKSDALEDVYYGVQIAYFAIIGTQMSMIVLSVMLIFGIYKENPGLIVPWIIGYITFMALEAVSMVYSNVLRDHVNKQFDAMCKAEVAFFIARAFINVLAMWGVLRFYNLVRSGITWKGSESKSALTTATTRIAGRDGVGYQRTGSGGARYCQRHHHQHRYRRESYLERKAAGCCAFLDFDDYDDDDEDDYDDEAGEYDYYYDDDCDEEYGAGGCFDYQTARGQHRCRYHGDGECVGLDEDYEDDNDENDDDEDDDDDDDEFYGGGSSDGSDCAMLGKHKQKTLKNAKRTARHCIGLERRRRHHHYHHQQQQRSARNSSAGHHSNSNNIRTVLINKRHHKYKIAQPQTRLEVINESERSAGSGSDENDSLLVAYDSTSSLASV